MNPHHPLRLETGIPGLDPILEGGFPEGGVYLVQGAPGTGKTILGNQMAFHHARQGRPVIFMTLLAESHTRMMAHLRRMAFFEPAVVPEHLHYLSAFKVLQQQGLDGILALLREEAERRQPKLVVIDGVASAEDAAGQAQTLKMFVHGLQTSAGFFGYTLLLLANSTRKSAMRAEHSMVDGIVDLADELRGLRTLRSLRVLKLRGSDPIAGQHTLEISDAGLAIHPRIETELALIPDVSKRPSSLRHGFGAPQLDTMLGGGLPDRSVTMVLGPSGCGKTVLGLRFLAEGVRRGERGVYFGFYEKPHELILKGERLGFGAELAGDQSVLVRELATEGVIDAIGKRLVDTVRGHRATRLVIDGIHGFQTAAEQPGRVRDVLTVLVDKLDSLGVTTIYTSETQTMFDASEVPFAGISAITDNIVLLRYLDVGTRVARVLSILKVRDSGYDASVRELRIGPDAIDAAPAPFSLELELAAEEAGHGGGEGPT